MANAQLPQWENGKMGGGGRGSEEEREMTQENFSHSHLYHLLRPQWMKKGHILGNFFKNHKYTKHF